MHKILKTLALFVSLAVLPGIVSAKGCIKGAIVGGIIGHYAGHHAVLGAAAGCVIEHERETAVREGKNHGERAAPESRSPAPQPPNNPNPPLPSVII